MVSDCGGIFRTHRCEICLELRPPRFTIVVNVVTEGCHEINDARIAHLLDRLCKTGHRVQGVPRVRTSEMGVGEQGEGQLVRKTKTIHRRLDFVRPCNIINRGEGVRDVVRIQRILHRTEFRHHSIVDKPAPLDRIVVGIPLQLDKTELFLDAPGGVVGVEGACENDVCGIITGYLISAGIEFPVYCPSVVLRTVHLVHIGINENEHGIIRPVMIFKAECKLVSFLHGDIS